MRCFSSLGLLGNPGINARLTAPPGISQSSTPFCLLAPRHPPHALNSLATLFNPPLCFHFGGNSQCVTIPGLHRAGLRDDCSYSFSLESHRHLSARCLTEFPLPGSQPNNLRPSSICNLMRLRAHQVVKDPVRLELSPEPQQSLWTAPPRKSPQAVAQPALVIFGSVLISPGYPGVNLSAKNFSCFREPSCSQCKPLQPPCGDEGTRTPDPLLAKQVLYQLSYAPAAGAYSFFPANPGGRAASRIRPSAQWAYLDSNQGPQLYQSCALAN
jgi:hypothetical protein